MGKLHGEPSEAKLVSTSGQIISWVNSLNNIFHFGILNAQEMGEGGNLLPLWSFFIYESSNHHYWLGRFIRWKKQKEQIRVFDQQLNSSPVMSVVKIC